MKNILLTAILTLTSATALASKARLIALGEEITGSQYISDSRNVFLNAATVNDQKNTVVLEWGKRGADYAPGGTPATVVKQDADNAAQAEGGVFFGWNNLVVGAYLGGESFQVHDARRYLNFQNQVVHQDNQLDVFVAGNAGIKWGTGLTYSKAKDDATSSKSQSLSWRLGAMRDAWEGFLNLSLANKYEGDINSSGTDEEFDGKLGYEVGGTFNTGRGKVFAFWRHAGWEQNNDVAITLGAGAGAAYVGEAEVETNRYIVGYGLEEKVTDKATIFWKASYVANRRTLDTQSEGKATLNDSAIPLTVGIEHDSASWLTLRGSITQNLIGEQDNDYDSTLTGKVSTLITGSYPDGKSTISNSTNVNAGATLKFGELSVDGLVGTGAGTSTLESGILTTDNLMARVSMIYKF